MEPTEPMQPIQPQLQNDPPAPPVPALNAGQRLLRFARSMQFSLILLGIIIAGCLAGSVIPQDAAPAVYQQQYGQTGTAVLQALGLDHVFSCVWFVAASALLCVNLLLCSILRARTLWRQQKSAYGLEKRLERQDADFAIPLAQPVTLSALGWRAAPGEPNADPDGWQYAVRFPFGVWGSWICHMGMLLVILGFAAGRLLSKEYVVYGIPGSVQPLGDSGYLLGIDDFEVRLRDDYTVEQYVASLTVTAADGSQVHGQAMVNAPLSAFGMDFYQDSTGWANYVDIAFDGQTVKQDLICVGEYTFPGQMPTLALMLNRFYPDLIQTQEGFTSATPLCQNPYSLYSIFYEGQLVAMNLASMGQEITVDRYSFTLRDPVQYTLIVAKSDPTVPLAGAGGLIVLAGMFMAFYCRPQELWTDGRTLYGKASKAPALLEQAIRRRLKAAAKQEDTPDE